MIGRVIAPPSLAERFDYLLISPELAKAMTGKEPPGKISYLDSEQSYTRRELLKVEKTTIKNKRDSAKLKEHYVAQINQRLHSVITNKLLQGLTNIQDLCENHLNWTADVSELIDVLNTKATTISKVESIAAGIPWLFDDLQKLVNQPRNRRRDQKGNLIPVDTLKTALSFIGIDNIKRVLPSLIYRQTLPQISDPYPQLKRKIWEYSFITARTAELLAVDKKDNPNFSYSLALFSQLGRSAILKLYFKLFEQVHMDFLQHAQKGKLRDLHTALVSLQADPTSVLPILHAHADNIAVNVLKHLNFKRIDYCTPLHQLIDNELSSPTATSAAITLQQSRYYAKYRMLLNHKLFIDNEQSIFIAGSGLRKEQIARLNSESLLDMPGLTVF